MKPRSMTRKPFHYDERGQPAKVHTHVRRLMPSEWVQQGILAHKVLAAHTRSGAHPDDREVRPSTHPRLAEAIASMKALLDPGPEPRKVYRGKGSNSIHRALWEQLDRLQHPEAYQTTPTATATPLGAYEAVLTACGVWLRIWSDDRRF